MRSDPDFGAAPSVGDAGDHELRRAGVDSALAALASRAARTQLVAVDRPPLRGSSVGPAARRGARAKTLAQHVRRGRAILGPLGETCEEHRLEIRRHGRAEPSGRRIGHRMQMMSAHFEDRFSAEDVRAGQQPVPDRAERIEVGPRVHGLRRGQRLGRDVERRPVIVLAMVSAGSDVASPARRQPTSFTRPKSTTFTRSEMPPRSTTRMLPGLTSR